MHPTSETHLQRERKDVYHKIKIMPLGWVDCSMLPVKSPLSFQNQKSLQGKPLSPLLQKNNQPITTKFKKPFALLSVHRYDASIEGYHVGDLGRWTYPLAKLYINLCKDLNLRAEEQTSHSYSNATWKEKSCF